MQKEKILILGASGLVGSALYEETKKRNLTVLGTYNNHFQDGLQKVDYGDIYQLKNLIDRFEPTLILCPAAKTAVDWIEQNPHEGWEINVNQINNLVKICKEKNITFGFFSTDYIFDGKNGPYSEIDIPNPQNFYGKHKFATEIMIQSLLPENSFIFRTTWVFGYENQEKNFLYSVIKNLREGKTLNVPEDMYATASYTPDIAKAVLDIIEKKLYGTYNVCGNDYISRYEYAKIIAKVFGLDSSLIIPVKYASVNYPAKRPLKAGLKNNKISDLINIKWTPVEDALKEVKEKIKEASSTKKKEVNITKGKKSRICIFIPCYNATVTLPKVFERIPNNIKEKVEEIFVVDNDSADYTYLMAIGYREKKSDIKNLRILKNQKNFGYGGSQKLAYAYAIKNEYDMVVMLHGDAQYAPEKLPVMIEKMENDESIDLLFGSRMLGDPLKGRMPLHRFLGNKALTIMQNFLLDTNISEFHSGYRIFRTSALRKIPFHLCSNDYHFDTELIILFIKNKFKVSEIPIDTFYGDEKNYVKIWEYGLNVLITTLCYYLQTKGLRTYKLYKDNIEADIEKIFREYKTEIY